MDLNFTRSLLSRILILILISSLISRHSRSEEQNNQLADVVLLQIPESPFSKSLRYVGASIKEQNYTIWGASPIVGEDGHVHLFAARWPEPNVDPAWRKSSEIAHYVAERPEGPFQFLEVVVKGSNQDGSWDRFGPHNPEIKKIDGKYILVYIANSDYHQPPHPLNQKIGMMMSDRLEGPWKKMGRDGLILESATGHYTEGRQVVNPALIKVGNRYHLYYKTTQVKQGKSRTVYGLAIADHLEGPYIHHPDPVTSENKVIEDASVFQWDNKVCLLTTDNHGDVSGLEGALVLWVSDDGIKFRKEWIQLAMRLFPDYLPDQFNGRPFQRIYGNRPKAERPKVLTIHDKPAYLYTASGFIYDGSLRCQNHVFRIELPEGAGPIPE